MRVQDTDTPAPALRDLFNKKLLVPHAYKRVAKQVALASSYSVAALDEFSSLPLWEREFTVSYIQPSGSRSTFEEARFDSLGARLPLYVHEYDLGASAESTSHKVVLARGCSCQQPCCSGLPCRHVLAVYQQLLTKGERLEEITPPAIEETIAPLWLLANHADKERAGRLDEWQREHMLKRCSAREGAGGSSSASARATPSELTSYALAQFRPLAALAAQQGEACVMELLAEVRKNKLVKKLLAGKRCPILPTHVSVCPRSRHAHGLLACSFSQVAAISSARAVRARSPQCRRHPRLIASWMLKRRWMAGRATMKTSRATTTTICSLAARASRGTVGPMGAAVWVQARAGGRCSIRRGSPAKAGSSRLRAGRQRLARRRKARGRGPDAPKY